MNATITAACAAKTETGARCRFTAVDGSRLCSRHVNMQGVQLAVWPNRILLKANINERQADKFLGLGVSEIKQDEQAKEVKHVAQAEEHGREAHRYRQVADSGVPVFGKNGAQSVSVEMALQELLVAYKFINVHLRARRDQNRWMRVLVVVLARDGERTVGDALLNALREFYCVSSWGFVHVWANPPQEDGQVVHTVNCSHKEEVATAKSNLRLADGLWAVEPCYLSREIVKGLSRVKQKASN